MIFNYNTMFTSGIQVKVSPKNIKFMDKKEIIFDKDFIHNIIFHQIIETNSMELLVILTDNNYLFIINYLEQKMIPILTDVFILESNPVFFFDNKLLVNFENASFTIYSIGNEIVNLFTGDIMGNTIHLFDNFLPSPNNKWIAVINHGLERLFVWSIEEGVPIYTRFEDFDLKELKWTTKKGNFVLYGREQSLFESKHHKSFTPTE